MIKTPREILEIAGVRNGQHETRLTLWQRFYQWFRPRRGCGCQKRRQRLNGLIPGLGDAVELVTRWTGVKRLVEWWTS